MTGARRSLRSGLSLVVIASLLSGAANAGTPGAQAGVPFDQLFGRSVAVQRANMVASIRTRLRTAVPSADTPAFEQTLAVIARISRERFVTARGRKLAYLAMPQEIGWGQTISDPYIVTVMTAALALGPGAAVLDVGTGSGYQAAALAGLARRVFSIEIVEPLARAAATRLYRLGYRNVEVRSGDGFEGWPEHAPFDGIVVAAGAAQVPRPLIDQLKPGARLVMPIGPTFASEQILVLTKQADGSTVRCSLGPAMFVDLTGQGETSISGPAPIKRTIPLCHGAPVT